MARSHPLHSSKGKLFSNGCTISTINILHTVITRKQSRKDQTRVFAQVASTRFKQIVAKPQAARVDVLHVFQNANIKIKHLHAQASKSSNLNPKETQKYETKSCMQKLVAIIVPNLCNSRNVRTFLNNRINRNMRTRRKPRNTPKFTTEEARKVSRRYSI